MTGRPAEPAAPTHQQQRPDRPDGRRPDPPRNRPAKARPADAHPLTPTTPPRTDDIARHILSSLANFSAHAAPAGRQLRSYQLEAGNAIVRSVLNGEGCTFTVMMARQSGKNELAAQLEAYLLTLFRAKGGDIIKAAPSFKPQIVNSENRLREILNEPLHRGRWQPHHGYQIQAGKARISFFSADTSANVVGATASILLEVDEAQDVDQETYLRSFRPMASTTNATTVLYGTAWSDESLLESQRRTNLQLERQTGQQLHFETDWQAAAAHNEKYKAFVEKELATLGPDHPTFRTQYLLHSLSTAGRMITDELLATMTGTHQRRRIPTRDSTIVIGVDIAGTTSEDGRPILNENDQTVATIAELDWATVNDSEDELPTVKILDHHAWKGISHPTQHNRLVQLTREWNAAKIAVDATGIGAGTAAWLEEAFGERVIATVFTAGEKSKLGYELLAAAETKRLLLYTDPAGPDLAECFSQLASLRYTLRAHETMAWEARDGHDDYATSLALCVRAAAQASPPAHGSLVRATDPDAGGDQW